LANALNSESENTAVTESNDYFFFTGAKSSRSANFSVAGTGCGGLEVPALAAGHRLVMPPQSIVAFQRLLGDVTERWSEMVRG